MTEMVTLILISFHICFNVNFGACYLKCHRINYQIIIPFHKSKLFIHAFDLNIHIYSGVHRNTFWECLNVGTVPTYKMHNIGTVPKFKMHNVGTVPMFKMHNVGTPKIYDLCFKLEFGLYKRE